MKFGSKESKRMYTYRQAEFRKNVEFRPHAPHEPYLSQNYQEVTIEGKTIEERAAQINLLADMHPDKIIVFVKGFWGRARLFIKFKN